jgi:hypothetical protein
MQVLPKSMLFTLFTGLPLFNSWATAWICTENSDIQPRRLSTSDAQQDFQQVIQVS